MSDDKALRSERQRLLASKQLLANQQRLPQRLFVRVSIIRLVIDVAAQSWPSTPALAATTRNTRFAQELVAPSIPLCSPHFLQKQQPVGLALAHARRPRQDRHLSPAYDSSSNSTAIASITDSEG